MSSPEMTNQSEGPAEVTFSFTVVEDQESSVENEISPIKAVLPPRKPPPPVPKRNISPKSINTESPTPQKPESAGNTLVPPQKAKPPPPPPRRKLNVSSESCIIPLTISPESVSLLSVCHDESLKKIEIEKFDFNAMSLNPKSPTQQPQQQEEITESPPLDEPELTQTDEPNNSEDTETTTSETKSAPVPIEPAVFEGILLKKSKTLGIWQKRYFRLYTHRLDYYEKIPPFIAGVYQLHLNGMDILETEPNGTIPLEEMMIHKIKTNAGDIHLWIKPHGRPYPGASSSSNSNARDYIFDAQNLEELDKWYQILKQQIAVTHEAFEVPPPAPPSQPKGSSLNRIFGGKKNPSSSSSTNRSSLSSSRKSLDEKSKSKTPGLVFGLDLDSITNISETVPDVPELVVDTISYLENFMETKGLFRESGSAVTISDLKKQFDEGTKVDLQTVEDIHAVAGLLKLFLREMANPLLTFELYDSFLEFANLPKEDRTEFLQILLHKLPSRHLATLKYLVEFLLRLAEKVESNLMTKSNISIVISPNILRNDNGNVLDSIMDSQIANQVFLYILEHFQEICSPLPQPDVDVSASSESENDS